MNEPKIKRGEFDGVDTDRFEGVFLPLKRPQKDRNIKELIMDNVEMVLDEIIKDLDKK